MACPICKSARFYIKDTEDEYETYDFELQRGSIRFEDADEMDEIPEVTDDREIFCQRCAWHGTLKQVE